MTKRMLIDTTHAEETRVVVLDGNRLDDYDVETASKKQLKGNIYLAKIVRIEPSLQAAFVEYGSNRHGFLAFSEIHPDYYQIPVADRERLIALQEEEARAEEARADREDEAEERRGRAAQGENRGEDEANADGDDHVPAHASHPDAGVDIGADTHPDVPVSIDAVADLASAAPLDAVVETVTAEIVDENGNGPDAGGAQSFEPAPETVSGETTDDGHAQRRTARFLRQYKIQEVMRRRQIILVQVVKEERGTKGAALTTYISLAGRFSVLMPNSPRGGGVSRKITSAADRRRLKEITQELEIPRGMGMIVRTAGAQRPRAEIKRDGEYLLRTWDDIRETTLASTAPCLVYEEASLIKRAIRDVYTRDVEEIVVDGETGWKNAREFMRMLMPANANKVGMWRESGQTLFGHYGVEHHLDAMLQPTVQLRSGGYLVINQTEALVAIDVNSGRSTKERGIEETAYRTNLEAADEVARQLRLRDLAGLIVIDFIDMEVKRNNIAVERRLKDALRNDRARIQVGSISHFGLLEMSRQRLRPSLAESSFVSCPHCAGTGYMRGTESSALHVLRAIEEEAGKRKASEILVHVAGPVALYVLNNKRTWLGEIENRYGLTVHLAADDSLLPPNLRIDRIRPYLPPASHQSPAIAAAAGASGNQSASTVTAVPITEAAPPALDPFADETDGDVRPVAEATETDAAAGESDENGRRRKRRRRRRGGRRENGQEAGTTQDSGPQDDDADENGAEDGDEANETADGAQPVSTEIAAKPETGTDPQHAGDGQGAARSRRRRGGKNRGRHGEQGGQTPGSEDGQTAHAQRPAARAYNGPTPADPFAGSYDIFEMIERDAEESAGPAPSVAPHQELAPAVAEQSVAPPREEAHSEAASEPASEASPVPVAEAGPDVTETAPAAEAETPAEAAKTPKARKPRATTPRTRKSKTADTTDTVKDAAVPADAAPAVAEEADTAKPAKPRRKPATSRARKAKTVSDTEQAAAAPAIEAVAVPDAPAPVDIAAAAGPDSDPSIVQPRVISENAPPAARRTGWWKR